MKIEILAHAEPLLEINKLEPGEVYTNRGHENAYVCNDSVYMTNLHSGKIFASSNLQQHGWLHHPNAKLVL